MEINNKIYKINMEFECIKYLNEMLNQKFIIKKLYDG